MSKRTINLENWNRREHFEFFQRYSDPYWSLTATVDVTKMYQRSRSEKFPFSLGYLYCAIKAMNQIEAFRMRIENGLPVLYDAVHASGTVSRSDGTFGFSIHPFTDDFEEFLQQGVKETERVRNEVGLQSPYSGNAVVFFTVIRGVHFQSLDHPKFDRKAESIPIIAFGEMKDGVIPVSVHIHHSLVDGQHVGQFFTLFQQYLNEQY